MRDYEGKSTAGTIAGWLAWALTAFGVVGLVVMGALKHVEMEKVKERIERLEGEVELMKDLVFQVGE